MNEAENDGTTPFFLASLDGHADCVSLLLAKQGIKANQSNNDRATPLYIARKIGHAECVPLLLAEQGIDANQATIDDGRTPTAIDVQKQHALVA